MPEKFFWLRIFQEKFLRKKLFLGLDVFSSQQNKIRFKFINFINFFFFQLLPRWGGYVIIFSVALILLVQFLDTAQGKSDIFFFLI